MTKTKLEKPEEIVKIFDDPSYVDRYEFMIDNDNEWEYTALTCSPNPESPQGVSQIGQGQVPQNRDKEKRIEWNEVPEQVQEHVIDRLN